MWVVYYILAPLGVLISAGACAWIMKAIAQGSKSDDRALKNDLEGQIHTAGAAQDEKTNRIDKSRNEDKLAAAHDVAQLEEMDEKRRADVAMLFNKDLWTKVWLGVLTSAFVVITFFLLWIISN